MYQVNGAPASEGSGGGEEEAGASYVELGQGGQEVLFVYCKYLRDMCKRFLFLGSNNRLELPHVWRTTAGMPRTKGGCPNEQLSDCRKV